MPTAAGVGADEGLNVRALVKRQMTGCVYYRFQFSLTKQMLLMGSGAPLVSSHLLSKLERRNILTIIVKLASDV